MAQQTSILRVRGKIGNLVGFTNSNSEKLNKDFVRQKAGSVSNPRTYKQAQQRAKVKPASAFYAAFENVLNHAFLPSQRASKNRNKFMKLAMTLPYVPDVPKDAAYLPILPYQVSMGSLGRDSLTELTFHQNLAVGAKNIRMVAISNNTTVGEMSQKILDDNVGLIEGQEITFLFVTCKTDNSTDRQASHLSFVIDSGDALTKVSDLLPSNIRLTTVADSVSMYLSFGVADSYQMLGAALIISSKTSSSWRYTNSMVYLSAAGLALIEDVEDVILSYMDGSVDHTSELILQQADNNVNDGAVVPISSFNHVLENAEGQSGTINDDTAGAACVRMSDGSARVMIDRAGQLYRSDNNGGYLLVTRTVDGVTEPCLIGTTNLAGNPTIPAFSVINQYHIPSATYSVNP